MQARRMRSSISEYPLWFRPSISSCERTFIPTPKPNFPDVSCSSDGVHSRQRGYKNLLGQDRGRDTKTRMVNLQAGAQHPILSKPLFNNTIRRNLRLPTWVHNAVCNKWLQTASSASNLLLSINRENNCYSKLASGTGLVHWSEVPFSTAGAFPLLRSKRTIKFERRKCGGRKGEKRRGSLASLRMRGEGEREQQKRERLNLGRWRIEGTRAARGRWS
jgi:hypothetical protein